MYCLEWKLFFDVLSTQDMLLKRAADIAEALYSMPRPHSQLQAVPSSPVHGSVMGLSSYPTQLGVSIGEPGQTNSQGKDPKTITLRFSSFCLIHCLIHFQMLLNLISTHLLNGYAWPFIWIMVFERLIPFKQILGLNCIFFHWITIVVDKVSKSGTWVKVQIPQWNNTAVKVQPF